MAVERFARPLLAEVRCEALSLVSREEACGRWGQSSGFPGLGVMLESRAPHRGFTVEPG